MGANTKRKISKWFYFDPIFFQINNSTDFAWYII